MTVTERDRDILARTLWGESRGEDFIGQIAVAWTIRNRVEMDLHKDGKPDWWGEGYAGVCLAKKQFSCWNTNDPNYPYLSGAKPIPARELTRARMAGDHVIDSKAPDPTNGATHYYATTMKRAPTWTKGAKHTLKLGDHIFFKEVP